MSKTIIALRARGGSGKSTTIAYAMEELGRYASRATVDRGRERKGGPPEVWHVIMNINGVMVGITSPGDTAQIVRRRVKPLIEEGCQVIVCATRTDGGSVEALEDLALEDMPPFGIQWIEKGLDRMDSERQNRATCAEIVSRVLAAVENFELAQL